MHTFGAILLTIAAFFACYYFAVWMHGE